MSAIEYILRQAEMRRYYRGQCATARAELAALRETCTKQAAQIEAQTELLDEVCREVFEYRYQALSTGLSVRLINRYHARNKAQETK